jgi:hypothetical protein
MLLTNYFDVLQIMALRNVFGHDRPRGFDLGSYSTEIGSLRPAFTSAPAYGVTDAYVVPKRISASELSLVVYPPS